MFFVGAYDRCDFESGLCTWTQLTTDEADLIRIRGLNVGQYDHTTDSQNGKVVQYQESQYGLLNIFLNIVCGL